MKKAGIIGVSGYTGLELIKILFSHPGFEISYLGASTQGEISEIFPLQGNPDTGQAFYRVEYSDHESDK